MKAKWIAVILILVFVGCSLSMCSRRDAPARQQEGPEATESQQQADEPVEESASPSTQAEEPIESADGQEATPVPEQTLPPVDAIQAAPIEPIFDSETNTLNTNQGVIVLDEGISGADSSSNTNG